MRMFFIKRLRKCKSLFFLKKLTNICCTFFLYVIHFELIQSIINFKKNFYMENGIISINNLDAIEVRENNRLAPRYGMDQLSFRATREKEQEVLRKCEKFLEKKELPLLVHKLEELGVKGVPEETSEIFIVLAKAVDLLKQGFHVLIIQAMMGCAGGNKSSLGYGAFDEKFTRALTDMNFRRELWGTVHLMPIDVVRFILIDLMNGINLDEVRKEYIKKSELVSGCLSRYSGGKTEETKFASFCIW